MCHETPASVQLGQLQRRQLAPHSSFTMTSDCGVKITDLGPNFAVSSVLIRFWCRFRTSRTISLGFYQHANDVHATHFKETPVNLIFFCVLLSKYGLLTQKKKNIQIQINKMWLRSLLNTFARETESWSGERKLKDSGCRN